MTPSFCRLALSFLFSSSLAGWSSSQSVPIPVANPSFEDFVLGVDCFTRQACSSCMGCQVIDPVPIPCWTVTSPGGHGTLNPGPGTYPTGAPDGVNVAWTGVGDDFPANFPLPDVFPIGQFVPELLTANTRYTLEVEVGRQVPLPYAGYSISLVAGQAPVELLAQAQEDPATPGTAGTFKTVTVVFDALPGDPRLGKLLGIRLGGHPSIPNNNTLRVEFDDVRLSKCTIPGSAVSYNGSGINPLTLQSLTPVMQGASWDVSLDCTGHGLGFALVCVRAGQTSGIVLPMGEILIDPSSPRLICLLQAGTGAVSTFSLAVPNNPALCGVHGYVQGLCTGSPGPRLSNGLDVTVGN